MPPLLFSTQKMSQIIQPFLLVVLLTLDMISGKRNTLFMFLIARSMFCIIDFNYTERSWKGRLKKKFPCAKILHTGMKNIVLELHAFCPADIMPVYASFESNHIFSVFCVFSGNMCQYVVTILAIMTFLYASQVCGLGKYVIAQQE